MLTTCRKIWAGQGGGGENFRCVLDMVNYPGWWGLGFEAGEVGDGAGNVGQWVLSARWKNLTLILRALRKVQTGSGGRYVKDHAAVQLRGEEGDGQGSGETRDAPPK